MAIRAVGVSSGVLFPWIAGDSGRISDDLLKNQVFLPMFSFFVLNRDGLKCHFALARDARLRSDNGFSSKSLQS